MPGLVPGIHDLNETTAKTWMAGTGPATTQHHLLAKSFLTSDAQFRI
jgi:hypothetical protein